MVQYVLNEKQRIVAEKLEVLYPDSSMIYDFDVDRLRNAVLLHVDHLQPYHQHWAEALALSLTPSELPHTTQTILKVSDDLCYYSGIRSTRMDWYYERAVVTGLYTATELFLLTDNSENFEETK